MAPLSQLPLECLHVIIHFILTDNNKPLATLSQLLCVNKYFASVTLPFIYSNPFPLSFSSEHGKYTRLLRRDKAYQLLTRMLLLRPPFTTAINSSVSKLISVCLCPQSIYTTTEETEGNRIVTPPVPSSLNYFAHIQHLNLDVGAMDPLQPVSQENWRSEQMYFLSAEFSQLRRSHHLARTYSNLLYHQRELVSMPRQALLYREVTWLFANPILGQLQSLTIPLSDIKRYTNVVYMMKSLEHIRYLLDEAWTHPVIRDSDGAEEKDARMEEVLSLAVQLVKDHVRLFPRRLRTVSSYNWEEQTGHSRHMIPEDVQLEIFRMLAPVQRMESLTGDNWMRVAAHPEATDLRFVETLLNNRPAEQWFGPSYDYRQLLQRCRALKNLDIPALGQGSFAWAVQEKRDHEGRIITNKGQGVAAWEEDLLPHGLVPLENFTIKEQLKSLTDEVDDVAFAFSQTLATITVTSSGTNTELRWIQLGRGWVDLPMLTRLEIQANSARLDLHPELLSHCPNVTYVKLSDRTYGYQCQDIVPCQAAHLAHVEILVLTGWSALTFHQATLHSAKRLTMLDVTLELDSEDGCFIPPPDELKWSYGIEDDSRVGTEFQEPPAILRPRWTWDWYLPCLTDLYLTSEFAYYIQFQFLRGCPSLRSLALDMHSVDNDCLTMVPEDLVAPSIWGDPTSPPARIIVPSLRSLSMRGLWIMNDAYMLDFMTGMFPNVEDWVLDGWEDITLQGLIAVLRTQQPTNHYKTVFTSLALPSKQEEEEFGMLKKTRVTGHEVLLPMTVYFYDMPYGEIHTVYCLTSGVGVK